MSEWGLTRKLRRHKKTPYYEECHIRSRLFMAFRVQVHLPFNQKEIPQTTFTWSHQNVKIQYQQSLRNLHHVQ